MFRVGVCRSVFVFNIIFLFRVSFFSFLDSVFVFVSVDGRRSFLGSGRGE